MGRNNSHATGRYYSSVVDRKRKNKRALWTEISIEDSVVQTLNHGMGEEGKFIINYSPSEEKEPDKFKAWMDNVMEVIKNDLKGAYLVFCVNENPIIFPFPIYTKFMTSLAVCRT